MDAGEQHPIRIQQRLQDLGLLLVEQLALGGDEAAVMMIMVPGDAAPGQ
jgi:hypothetical protein